MNSLGSVHRVRRLLNRLKTDRDGLLELGGQPVRRLRVDSLHSHFGLIAPGIAPLPLTLNAEKMRERLAHGFSEPWPRPAHRLRTLSSSQHFISISAAKWAILPRSKDEYFQRNYPTCAVVGVTELALPELRVELRAVAVAGSGEE
jgi:hypothetical protein